VATPQPAPQRANLAGRVERVTFHNEDSGFCVLRVKARGQRDLITVVGHAAPDARRAVPCRCARRVPSVTFRHHLPRRPTPASAGHRARSSAGKTGIGGFFAAAALDTPKPLDIVIGTRRERVLTTPLS
jgi:hypothetical protein